VIRKEPYPRPGTGFYSSYKLIYIQFSFHLQEEMAFVLEMLGLYEEALVQYDELDALFTQFVLNSNVGGKVKSFAVFFEHVKSNFMFTVMPNILDILHYLRL
jgi:hypothetical protein